MSELENALAGCFVAILTALGRDATERAVETLWAFVEDPRTPPWEGKYYADLAASIEQASTPGAYAWVDCLTGADTLH